MRSRRFFLGCAIAGFAATGVEAQAATAGVMCRILQQTEGPASGYVFEEGGPLVPPA
jgi:hypothetical protein